MRRTGLLPRDGLIVVREFLLSLLARFGLDDTKRRIIGEGDREVTAADLEAFVTRLFAGPAAGADSRLTYSHRMAAFHNRMPIFWLQEFGRDGVKPYPGE